jgi:hypothetical protein
MTSVDGLKTQRVCGAIKLTQRGNKKSIFCHWEETSSFYATHDCPWLVCMRE